MRRQSSLLQALAAALQSLQWRLWAFVRTRSPAQGLVEYSLILALIMVVCVVIIGTVGQTTSELWYQKVLDAFPA